MDTPSRFDGKTHYIACKKCYGTGWISFQNPNAPPDPYGHGCDLLQEPCSDCDDKDDDDPNTWGWAICESAYYCDTDEHHKLEGYNPED